MKEKKKGSPSASVIIVHLQAEVRRVYGDLHAELTRLRHTKVVREEGKDINSSRPLTCSIDRIDSGKRGLQKDLA